MIKLVEESTPTPSFVQQVRSRLGAAPLVERCGRVVQMIGWLSSLGPMPSIGMCAESNRIQDRGLG